VLDVTEARREMPPFLGGIDLIDFIEKIKLPPNYTPKKRG